MGQWHVANFSQVHLIWCNGESTTCCLCAHITIPTIGTVELGIKDYISLVCNNFGTSFETKQFRIYFLSYGLDFLVPTEFWRTFALELGIWVWASNVRLGDNRSVYMKYTLVVWGHYRLKWQVSISGSCYWGNGICCIFYIIIFIIVRFYVSLWLVVVSERS